MLVFIGAVMAQAGEQADEILKIAGVNGGLLVHVGCGDGKLTAELGASDSLVVHGIDVNEASIQEARKRIASTGKYGVVSVGEWDGVRLPYTDNLVNAIVCSDPTVHCSAEEIARVLAPRGVACVTKGFAFHVPGFSPESSGDWVLYRKPVPPEIDDWSHHCHGADGNPVAQDDIVGPPKRLQWIQHPLWMRAHDTDSSISCMVSSQGRVFYMEDCAPISLPGNNSMPDDWHLTARDAFNGILLWKIPVEEWGWREWKDTWFASRGDNIPVNVHRRVVAVGDRVYATLGFDAAVSEIDAATGRILSTYAGTEGAREILCHDGQLFLTVPVENRLKLTVLDPTTGNVEWQTDPIYGGTARESARVPMLSLPVLNAAVDSEGICFINGSEIVCLDCRSGKPRWTKRLEAHGMQVRTKRSLHVDTLWAGVVIVSDGVVIHSSPGEVLALSMANGEELWSKATSARYQGLWFSWKDVFVIDGVVWTWMGARPHSDNPNRAEPPSVQGFCLKTGELTKTVSTGNIFNVHHHHRCYRNKATPRYILASRRGTEFVDLEEGDHVVNVWVRGMCHLGMMPANGFQYAPPHPCKCYNDYQLNGFLALASELADEGASIGKARLKTGPAFGRVHGPDVSPADWPMFRGNAKRSCSARADIPSGDLKILWKKQVRTDLTAPIAVGDTVYVASKVTHTLCALARNSGEERWHFIANGLIDTPPTYSQGKLFFGTRNGYVYCLSAEDGTMAWRFRAAPQDRFLGAFNRLESAWPVHGSVLVHDGIAYLAAGRSSHLDGGIHLYGLDPETGSTLHHTVLQGPETNITDPHWHDTAYAPDKGYLNDILMSTGEYIHMRQASFDRQLATGMSMDRIRVKGGFLDDTYFQRIYAYYESDVPERLRADTRRETRDSDYSPFFNALGMSQILIHDEKTLYGTRMFEHQKLLNDWNYFTPGKRGYTVFAVDEKGKDTHWSLTVPVGVKAMAVGKGKLAIAGPPDVMDLQDPFAAYRGRQGGTLRILSAGTGKELAELKLESPPVLNGIAAANSKLFLSLKNGAMVCIGER